MKFIRFGGLSRVNYKKIYKKDTYHSPPRKRGIYAFVYPYIDSFMFAFKYPEKRYKEYYQRERRIFNYDGDIWVHWIKECEELGIVKEKSKQWVKIHTNNFEKAFKKVKHNDIVELQSDPMDDTLIIHDPYKRGLNGWMCKDHLEVFIERVK